MTDEESEAYGNWTKTLREAVYGTNGAITLGMLIADLFGCLGMLFELNVLIFPNRMGIGGKIR